VIPDSVATHSAMAMSTGFRAGWYPVLAYHNVGSPGRDVYPEQTISPERFERHLAWLSGHGYVGIGLRDWIDRVGQGRSSTSGTLLITFDDGYAALAQHAFPLLLKYGFSACVFVVTGRLGKTNTWDEALGYQSHPLLSREEILFWAGRGIDFGAHGRTHADLTTLSPLECQREVLGSRDELGAIFNRVPLVFAYPYGHFNATAIACVRAGFRMAFSSRLGVNTSRTDPYRLRRALVHPRDSMVDLAFRVRCGFSPVARMRSSPRPEAMNRSDHGGWPG
jgi:peptidoglycan/xylan/chitin deacetylase (PgdA/CDA1 family)